MLLKGLLDEVGGLQNATKKRKIRIYTKTFIWPFRDIAELGGLCLILNMRSLFAFLLFVAVSTQAATTASLDFQQSGQFSNYFNGDSSPVWSQSPSAGVGGTGGVQWTLGGSDVWVAKVGFQPSVGSTYTLSVQYLCQINSGYGGIGLTSQNSNLNLAGSTAGVNPGLGISYHGSGFNLDNNSVSESETSWTLTDYGRSKSGNDGIPSPGRGSSGNYWSQLSLKMKYLGSNQFELTPEVYDVSQTTGAVGSMMASGATRTITNSNLGTASVLYPYFSSNGSRFVGADNITMPVPEPSALSLLASGLGALAILRRRRS
jgi:hypothetical protein